MKHFGIHLLIMIFLVGNFWEINAQINQIQFSNKLKVNDQTLESITMQSDSG